MTLKAIEVARLLIMHGAWEDVFLGDHRRWGVSIDGISSADRRKELVQTFQGICPSAKACLIPKPGETVWTLLVDPLEVKDARAELRSQRDADGRFTSRISSKTWAR